MELLGVVTIILIIAAVTAPNLLRSRVVANEAVAVASLRAINAAASSYKSIYANGFPRSLAQTGTSETGGVGCNHAGLIDSALTAGTKSGYTFAIIPGLVPVTAASGCNPGNSDGYVVTATPLTVGSTGHRAFCSDASGVVRFNRTGRVAPTPPRCAVTDSPLQ